MTQDAPGDASEAEPVALSVLLDRAALGDRDAFARLHDRFAADVGRLSRRLLGGPEEADDVANEVFLRAQTSFAGYDRSRPFRTWLLSIAAHQCIDRLRKRRREGRLYDDAELSADDLPASGPSPLRQALLSERRDALFAALGALPYRYRAPLALRYFAELSYEEISALLEVTPNQVGVLLHRAKRRLRDALGEMP